MVATLARRRPAALVGALALAAALALGAVVLLGAQPGRDALYEEDDLSEAELAGRLSHAIDAHEKCRRHWPHLERLEAAQEIRVHDARNNLEVANRAMERARKELRDAEGLVLAARQEHQAYEAQRVAFQSFKSDYDQRTLAMKEVAPTVQLAQRSDTGALDSSVQAQTRLEAVASRLEQEQAQAMELESGAMAALKERTAAELAASTRARTQDLAQVAPAGPKAILTRVRSGIVVPDDSQLAARRKAARKARTARANKAAKLVAEEATLKHDEVKAFAELPAEEKMAQEIERDVARQQRRLDVQRSRSLITRRKLRFLERREADDVLAGMAKKVQFAKAQKSLAEVNYRITERKLAEEQKELATLKQEERAGPSVSAKLSEVKESLRRMRRRDRRPTALLGNLARETQLVQVDNVSGDRGKRGRTDQPVPSVAQARAKKESRAQVRYARCVPAQQRRPVHASFVTSSPPPSRCLPPFRSLPAPVPMS